MDSKDYEHIRLRLLHLVIDITVGYEYARGWQRGLSVARSWRVIQNHTVSTEGLITVLLTLCPILYSTEPEDFRGGFDGT